MSAYISLLWSQLSSIFWRDEEATAAAQIAALESGWEWFLSPAERIILDQIAAKSSAISEELQTLKRTNQNFHSRSTILARINEVMSQLSETDVAILAHSRILLPDQTSIFRDIFRRYAAGWQLYLTSCLQSGVIAEVTETAEVSSAVTPIDVTPTASTPTATSSKAIQDLTNNWEEQEYAKNVLGQILSKTLEASVAAAEKGLTQRILCDIVWRLHLSLSKVLVEYRQMFSEKASVTQAESDELLNLVIATLPSLLSSWITTWQRVEKVQDKAGKLPTKWAEAEQVEKQRLQTIKECGGVDARYNPETIADWSNTMKSTGVFEDTVTSLSSRLVFRLGPGGPSGSKGSKDPKDQGVQKSGLQKKATIKPAKSAIIRGPPLKSQQIQEVERLFNALHGLTTSLVSPMSVPLISTPTPLISTPTPLISTPIPLISTPTPPTKPSRLNSQMLQTVSPLFAARFGMTA